MNSVRVFVIQAPKLSKYPYRCAFYQESIDNGEPLVWEDWETNLFDNSEPLKDTECAVMEFFMTAPNTTEFTVVHLGSFNLPNNCHEKTYFDFFDSIMPEHLSVFLSDAVVMINSFESKPPKDIRLLI
jgi:hypothetical protein